jgi:hypothetical protein
MASTTNASATPSLLLVPYGAQPRRLPVQLFCGEETI